MSRSVMPAAAWLSVLCSPMSMAMAAAFCTGLALLHDVARVLRRAEVVRQQVAATAVELVAETALVARLESDIVVGSHMGGAYTSSVERQDGAWLVCVRWADGQRWFAGPELVGAAAAAFGCQRSLGLADGPEPWRMPELDPGALAHAQRAERSAVFVRDNGIALLHLPVGTDRDDFTLGSGCGRVSFAGLDELIVVPGHLWVEPANSPLLLQVDRDTVVVVQGNAYVGRPLQVQGAGRLVLVTTVVEGACAFADLDGDGRWSVGDRLRGAAEFHGPVEGCGNARLGGAAGSADFEVGAALVVAGELMLDRPVAIRGPLVVAHGVTATRPAGELLATSAWTFRTDRERVPGFNVAGPARPGRLSCVGEERPPQPFGSDSKQTLYLGSPTR